MVSQPGNNIYAADAAKIPDAGQPCAAYFKRSRETRCALPPLQTGNLKDAVSNAALIGSVLGQLGFGFAGDL